MKKILSLLLAALLVCTLSICAFADTGPKPSVRVSFTNAPADTVFYGTLLSQRASNGPNSVWDGNENYAYHNGNYDWCELDYDTWLAFVEYEDADGYYFLQEGWLCSDTLELAWLYYPPSPFKVLLYFPATDTFAVSGVCERYAFDSYYTVDLGGLSLDTGGLLHVGTQAEPATLLPLEENYDYTQELLSLLARILTTLALELAVAYAFGLLKNGLVGKLIAVNALTQVLLNLLLNIVNYNKGAYAFVAYYILLELGVVLLEGALYAWWVRRHAESAITPRRTWCYAVVANACSFGCGMLVAYFIPGIF